MNILLKSFLQALLVIILGFIFSFSLAGIVYLSGYIAVKLGGEEIQGFGGLILLLILIGATFLIYQENKDLI